MERYLVLDDNTIFKGTAFGSLDPAYAELAFTTMMTGYQESITDPSFDGQIIVFSFPMIGNTGINRDDFESIKPVCAGVVVRSYIDTPSNWRTNMTLDAYLKQENIPGISGIDTRQLIRHIRRHGIQNAKIVDQLDSTVALQVPAVDHVSIKTSFRTFGDSYHVTLLDLGAKHSILKELTLRNCQVHVLPYNSSVEAIMATQPDGILLSNGPGNPEALTEVIANVKQLHDKAVLFGICLGHQVLALSFGAKTYKMPYGHRGSNHVVSEISSGKQMFTSQNHGYAVSDDGLDACGLIVTHREINDLTIEGLKHRNYPIMSVQFHPDATPGPHDARQIFDTFIEMMESQKERVHDFK